MVAFFMLARPVAFVSIILVFLAFISCTQQATQPQQGGILRLGSFHKPTEINPLTTDSSISANLLDLIFDSLVRLDSEQNIEAELAKRWEVSPDGLQWTFYLRPDIVFHDGTALTAEDVKFTYDHIINSHRGAYTVYFQFVKEVRVLDTHTVQISLSQFDNVLWTGLAYVGIAPKHLLAKPAASAQFNQHPIGSGAYRFVRRTPQEIILEANQNYYQQRPYLDRIAIVILPSQGAVLNHLIAEQLDMAFLLNPEDYGALNQIPSIKIYNNWYPFLYLLTLDNRNPLFRSTTNRRLLNQAINKEQIIQRLLKDQGEIAASTVPSKSPFYNAAVTPYPHDPKGVAKMLAKSGWKTHNKDHILRKNNRYFEFTAYAMEGHSMEERILLNVQEQLLLLGIKMNITVLPFDQYIKKIFREQHFDANLIFFVFRDFYGNNSNIWDSQQIKKGINYLSYANPEIDRLLKTIRLARSKPDQIAALKEFQRIIHDDPPGIFLFWRNMPIAVHKRFRGIPTEQMKSLRDLVHVWVPKEEQISKN